MIVELEMLNYRPGVEAQVTSAYGEAVAAGHAPSPLVGYWTVDVGRLNSAALLWPFADADAREQAVAARTSAAQWPPELGGIVNSSESLVLEPAPFNDVLEPGAQGGLYEIRIYDYEAGSIGTVIERWAPMIDGRRAMSPLTGCFFSSGGPTDKWVHIWAFDDAATRQRVRADAVRQGIWPPRTSELLVKQENMLVLPAPFSPLH